RGGRVQTMGRGRRGTLSLVVSGPISRTVPVARVGSRDHERVVGDVVVSRLRSDDALVPRLRIAVPASALVFLEGFEVVAGKGSSRGSPSLVRLSRLFPKLSRMWGLSE